MFKDVVEKNYRVIISGIFVFALVLRIGSLMFNQYLDQDAYTYLKLSTYLADHGIIEMWDANLATSWIPPFYIVIMGGLVKLGLSAKAAGLGISFIASIVVVVNTYFIARLLFRDKRLIALFLTLVAVNPVLVSLSSRLIRDGLYLALFSSELLFLLQGYFYRKNRYYFVAGIIAALSIATRDEGLETVLLLGVILSTDFFMGCKKFFKQIVKKQIIPGAIYLMALIITISPFFILVSSSKACHWQPFSYKKIIDSMRLQR